MIMVPQFQMGSARDDWMRGTQGVANALGQWRARQMQSEQFQAQQDLARARMAQQDRQWSAGNALAQAQFGLMQNRDARDAALSPLELKLRQAQIDAANAGVENLPIRRDLLLAQTQLAQAQAKAAGQKDVLNSAIAGILNNSLAPQGAPQAPPPPSGFQPQSFDGSAPPMQPQPMSAPDTGGDPMLIQTQTAVPQPRQAPGPDMVDTPLGKMPIDRARQVGFALGLAGKGDAGKMLTDAANADALDKTARNEVQKDMVGLVGTIGRLESISKRFDPKFLNIPERAGFAWTALKDKFGELPPEKQQELARFTKFRQTSVQNAALYVKYLSGVAVSEAEFARIMKTLPNAGTGIFDGDSPAEFKAKMDEAINQAKMAYARAHYLNKRGTKGKPWEAGVAIDDIPGLVSQRGYEIQRELLRRGMPADKIGPATQREIKREFGI